MEARKKLIEQGYNPSHVDLTEEFAWLAASLIDADLDNAEPLRRGIDTLARKMNSIAPDLEEGDKTRGVRVAELAPTMAPIPEEAIAEFIRLAGTMMLLGQDGPLGTAVPLKECIDALVERWTKHQ
jgi:hypothetical protein